MKVCPYCAEEIQDAAIKCKHCGEILESSGVCAPGKRLYKSRRNCMLMGVCGGIAGYANMDASLVRILAVVIMVCTFPVGLIAYFVAGFILPEGE